MASPASSSTLWATPSKEWVIPPKAKAGRKPKKDLAKAEDDVDSTGRRVQNRAAQRAFRERKQSQLKELQARISSYENAEMERNVALQNVAKRLKEENETLRAENAALKNKLAEMAQQLENDRKRWRDDTPSSSSSSRPVKKQRLLSIPPSPPSMVSSPESDAASDLSFSPIQLDPPHVHSTLSNLIEISAKSGYESDIFSSFSCGLCTADTHCVCRQVAFQHVTDTMVARGLKFETYDQNNNVIAIEQAPSILDNLPAYQPPVPLRRRPPSTRTTPVFWAVPASSNCSGDPSNCEACANDSFGQAFCEAINRSVSAQGRCADCPCTEANSGPSPVPRQDRPFSSSNAEDHETMPTNNAWQQLKSHPGVSFADLALLADVVARRSKCTGPRVTLSPLPETEDSSLQQPVPDEHEPDSVLLADPHAHYHEKVGRRLSPKLIPQEILVKCGQERVRQVQAAGVRDALRLLDARLAQ